MVKKLLELFMKKYCLRQIKKNLEYKNWLKEKEKNYMSNGRVMILHLIGGLTKSTFHKNESILS